MREIGELIVAGIAARGDEAAQAEVRRPRRAAIADRFPVPGLPATVPRRTSPPELPDVRRAILEVDAPGTRDAILASAISASDPPGVELPDDTTRAWAGQDPGPGDRDHGDSRCSAAWSSGSCSTWQPGNLADFRALRPAARSLVSAIGIWLCIRRRARARGATEAVA